MGLHMAVSDELGPRDDVMVAGDGSEGSGRYGEVLCFSVLYDKA